MALLEQLVADPAIQFATKAACASADVQILLRDGRPLSIPGGAYTFNNWNGQKMLDPFGSGIYIYTADPSTNLGAYGNSYIQFVTWDNAGPIAEGLLTYGQSAHPSSPHFSDQTKRYATGEWVKLPYTGSTNFRRIDRRPPSCYQSNADAQTTPSILSAG
jgi:acyl-homoserine-lactone acylase